MTHWLAGCLLAATLAGCSPVAPSDKPDDAALWAAVEARHESWQADTPNAYLSHYHSDFARWKRNAPELMRRSDMESYRAAVGGRENTLSVRVDPEALVWLADGQVALAHYTLEERIEWLGDPFTDRFGNRYEPGSRYVFRIRFSDVMAKEDGAWAYVGGHKDGMTLPNRGLVEPSGPER